MPLNIIHVGEIFRIFPDAKFILALRHPFDTIFSCWMHKFKLNAAMANMVDIEQIVKFFYNLKKSDKLKKPEIQREGF